MADGVQSKKTYEAYFETFFDNKSTSFVFRFDDPDHDGGRVGRFNHGQLQTLDIFTPCPKKERKEEKKRKVRHMERRVHSCPS